MSNSIHDILQQISELLRECGWEEKASWFINRSSTLRAAKESSSEFVDILHELDGAVAGMGSLTDLPLTPRSNRLTIQQARDEQWKLAEALGNAIEELMPSS